MLKQNGITLSGFIFWLIIFAFGALLGFKLAPAYTEDMTIKRHFKILANDSSLATGNRRDVEVAFSKRAEIDRVEAITPKDIVITKEGSGISLSASYTVRVPLVYNISACMDFNPASR